MEGIYIVGACLISFGIGWSFIYILSIVYVLQNEILKLRQEVRLKDELLDIYRKEVKENE